MFLFGILEGVLLVTVQILLVVSQEEEGTGFDVRSRNFLNDDGEEGLVRGIRRSGYVSGGPEDPVKRAARDLKATEEKYERLIESFMNQTRENEIYRLSRLYGPTLMDFIIVLAGLSLFFYVLITLVGPLSLRFINWVAYKSDRVTHFRHGMVDIPAEVTKRGRLLKQVSTYKLYIDDEGCEVWMRKFTAGYLEVTKPSLHKVEEMNTPGGKIYQSIDALNYVIQASNAGGVVGNCCILRFEGSLWLATAIHVYKNMTDVIVHNVGNKMWRMANFVDPKREPILLKREDFAMIPVIDSFGAATKLKTLVMADWGNYGSRPITVMAFSGGQGVMSGGNINDEIDEQIDDSVSTCFTHTASTRPGFSGAPLLVKQGASWRYLGTHLGARVDDNVNYYYPASLCTAVSYDSPKEVEKFAQEGEYFNKYGIPIRVHKNAISARRAVKNVSGRRYAQIALLGGRNAVFSDEVTIVDPDADFARHFRGPGSWADHADLLEEARILYPEQYKPAHSVVKENNDEDVQEGAQITKGKGDKSPRQGKGEARGETGQIPEYVELKAMIAGISAPLKPEFFCRQPGGGLHRRPMVNWVSRSIWEEMEAFAKTEKLEAKPLVTVTQPSVTKSTKGQAVSSKTQIEKK